MTSDQPPPYGQGPGPASYGSPPPYPVPQQGPAGGYPPQYGQQVPGYPAYAPAPRPTNTMAILALIFAFVFAPLGIVFGIIGRSQIKRTGEGGDGLALAGLIVGAAFTALFVVYIIFLVIAIGSAVSSLPTT